MSRLTIVHRDHASHPSNPASGRVAAWTRAHPVGAFLAWIFTVGWAIAVTPVVLEHAAGIDLLTEPFLIASTLIGLLLPALAITRLVDGPAGPRELRRRVFTARISLALHALAWLAIPLIATALAVAASGARRQRIDAGRGAVRRPARADADRVPPEEPLGRDADAMIVAEVASGRVALWNPAAARLFGYPTEHAIGLPVSDLLPDEEGLRRWTRERLYRLASRIRPGSEEHLVLQTHDRGGAVFMAEVSIGAVDAETDPTRFVLARVRRLGAARDGRDRPPPLP